jgi:hypothetical protein
MDRMSNKICTKIYLIAKILIWIQSHLKAIKVCRCICKFLFETVSLSPPPMGYKSRTGWVTKKLLFEPGVNVMITILGEKCVFLKKQCYDPIFAKISSM